MKRILLIVTAFLSVLAVSTPAVVMAATAKDSVCEGVGLTTGTNGCAEPADSPDVETTILNVIRLLGLIVGIASVIMIIFGGFRFITSSGDSAKIASARDTVLYAIVGLVVAALSQAIVAWVLSRAT